MKYIIRAFFIYLFLSILLRFEYNMMERRALFIANVIEKHISNNGKIPTRLDDVNSIFIPSDNPESYCSMFSLSIDGVGECFYTPNKDNYFILIYGFFIGSGYYSSETKSFQEGTGLN